MFCKLIYAFVLVVAQIHFRVFTYKICWQQRVTILHCYFLICVFFLPMCSARHLLVLCWLEVVRGLSFFFPCFKRKNFNISCGFVMYGIYFVEVYSFFISFVCYHGRIWILSYDFSASSEITWLLSDTVFMWYLTLTYLPVLKHYASQR